MRVGCGWLSLYCYERDMSGTARTGHRVLGSRRDGVVRGAGKRAPLHSIDTGCNCWQLQVMVGSCQGTTARSPSLSLDATCGTCNTPWALHVREPAIITKTICTNKYAREEMKR